MLGTWKDFETDQFPHYVICHLIALPLNCRSVWTRQVNLECGEEEIQFLPIFFVECGRRDGLETMYEWAMMRQADRVHNNWLVTVPLWNDIRIQCEHKLHGSHSLRAGEIVRKCNVQVHTAESEWCQMLRYTYGFVLQLDREQQTKLCCAPSILFSICLQFPTLWIYLYFDIPCHLVSLPLP